MTWILRIFWFLAGHRLKGHLLDQLKSRGVVAYLQVLQGSRRFLILALAAFLILQLTMLAAVGTLVTAFILWNYDFQTKMEILFLIFLILFLFPLGLLAWALSESVWYKASGAQQLVEDIRKKAD